MSTFARQVSWGLAALIASAAIFTPPALAQQQKPSRSDLRQGFKKIEQRTRSAMRGPGVQKRNFPVNARSKATLIGGTRFNPVGVAIEYEFELVPDGQREGSGEFVNPVKYKFRPKERFFLRLKTASPVQVALYQVYDDGQPDRLVLPSDQYPESYNTITPDQGFVRYPVLLEMDDDTRPETMMIIAFSPDTLKKGGNLSVDDTSGDDVEDGEGTDFGDGGEDTLVGENGVEIRGLKSAVLKTASRVNQLHKSNSEFQRRTRFQQGAAVRQDDPTVSTDPETVSVVALNPDSKIGVLTIKIPKTPR